MAAATYLKNFTKRNIDGGSPRKSSKVGKELKNQLFLALLQVQPPVLKVLVEAVCSMFSRLQFAIALFYFVA